MISVLPHRPTLFPSHMPTSLGNERESLFLSAVGKRDVNGFAAVINRHKLVTFDLIFWSAATLLIAFIYCFFFLQLPKEISFDGVLEVSAPPTSVFFGLSSDLGKVDIKVLQGAHINVNDVLATVLSLGNAMPSSNGPVEQVVSTIRSPVSGTVVQIPTTSNSLGNTREMFFLISKEQLKNRIIFYCPSSIAAYIKINQKLSVTLINQKGDRRKTFGVVEKIWKSSAIDDHESGHFQRKALVVNLSLSIDELKLSEQEINDLLNSRISVLINRGNLSLYSMLISDRGSSNGLQ